MAKKRLDVLLFERGYAESREKAKTIIMSGIVYVNGVKEDKPGSAFADEESLGIEVRGNTLKYVSRGGLKLEKAIDVFGISVDGFTCMDIGASTGGFTDCMLQNGAAKVFAVDVGHGQLAWKLRNDERVICMEKMNIRYIQPSDINDEKLDFASVDVSFISLDKVLPAVRPLLKDEAHMVCLIKPQFEAGRDEVGKKGVVRDKGVHRSVVSKITGLCTELGFSVLGLTFSPVKGPEGNIEYLIYISNTSDDPLGIAYDEAVIERLVEEAHGELDK
ncbi:MAG: TlyA family RNA methyltransferase [Eubacteriales bacterium]|nr:TlyA family RNA methyltransferase [Eubacteriales bacterium]